MVADNAEPLAVAEAFVRAYNEKDVDRIGELLSPEIRTRHHNRGVDLGGPEPLLEMIRQFESIVPNRRWHSMRRQIVTGDIVIFEHVWEATFTVDVEGFAAKDEIVALDICSVYTVKDGLIVQYDDYG